MDEPHNRKPIFLFVVLILLLLDKGWLPVRGVGALGNIPVSLVSMIFWGAPQIVALIFLSRVKEEASLICWWLCAFLFFVIYAWCGFMPWDHDSGLGGAAHFEVPIGFFLEWAAVGLSWYVAKGLS